MKKLAMLVTLALAALPAFGWTPPDKPDPKAILNEARADRVAGRFEDALQKHLWFHREAVKIEPALYGVRGSFAISDWAHLASKYPPAMEALLALRRQAAAQVVAGRDSRDAFFEVADVDRALEEWSETHRLFIHIEAADAELARTVYPLAKDALVEAKDFGRAAKYMDPAKEIRTAHEMEKDMGRLKLPAEIPADMRQRLLQTQERIIDARVGQTVAILVLGGRSSDARAAATLARETFKRSTLEPTLARALEGQLPPPVISAADRAMFKAMKP